MLMRDPSQIDAGHRDILQVRGGRVILNGERRYEPYTPELASYEMAEMQARAIMIASRRHRCGGLGGAGACIGSCYGDQGLFISDVASSRWRLPRGPSLDLVPM